MLLQLREINLLLQPVCEKKVIREIDTGTITWVRMQCKQRDACDARTKSYTDGRICRDQGNNRVECITCAFGEEGTDYTCAG